MKRPGQSSILLVVAMLLIPPASALSSGKPDHQPCPPDLEDLQTAGSSTQNCSSEPVVDPSSPSAHVVHVSDLRNQYSELKLSQEEVRNLVLNAKDPDDHLRLASYYGLRADADLAQARQHQKIALIWSANPLGSSSKYVIGTVNHCLDIARRFKQHAAKMRKLQEEQEDLARQAGE